MSSYHHFDAKREKAEKFLRWAKVFTVGVTVFWVVAIVGWVMNIIKVAQADLEPLTTMLVLRIIGVVLAPLGAVLGYL